MPYITIPIKHTQVNISFEDILNGINDSVMTALCADTHDTKTYWRESISENMRRHIDIERMLKKIREFNVKYTDLINMENKSNLYYKFYVPKANGGGLREINAPERELKTALYELKMILEKDLYATYHTSAFAYIEKRCITDALKRHQGNNSRWFLKLDFHNFFGSTTLDFLISQLKTLYPFSEIFKTDTGESELKRSFSLCFLNGGLPQGTPISPLLTNIMMIPLDYALSKYSKSHSPHLCYTRYADDLLLSSEYGFDWRTVQKDITSLLVSFNAPFKLNINKTRYGSRCGANWNLGLMLNKDNQITIGHRKKKTFKVMLYSLINDYKNNVKWCPRDAQVLSGLISYYRSVEKENIDKIINAYNLKFETNIMNILKDSMLP